MTSPVSPAVKKLMEKVESDEVGLGSDDAMADGKGETQAGSDVGSIEVGENENNGSDGEEEML